MRRSPDRLNLVQIAAACLCTFAALHAAAAEQSEFLALHPDNPHYFAWRGKPTILVTSGEHYGALLNKEFHYGRYFEELSKHGLNHTRVFSGAYRETPASFGITDNTLAPSSGQFLCPWLRSDQPGDFDGGHSFDLTRWDPAYFARLKDLMSQARSRGIVVEFTLFCPLYDDEVWKASPLNPANNINDLGDVKRTDVYTLKHPKLLDLQLTLTRKLVGELKDFGNLYFEVCNEPYFGGVTMEWQHRIVDAIVAAEADLPAKHLISMNIANGQTRVADPHPAVSIFNFHYCVPPDTVALNYGLKKIIGENETGFRGRADLLYRTEGWDFLMAGGALYNSLDYSFTTGHADGSLRDYRSPGGGSTALRQQLGILKKFLDGFDLPRMQPDEKVVRDVSPKGSARALVERGQAYAIYLHAPIPGKTSDAEITNLERTEITSTITLELPPGENRVEWINPQTGAVEATELFVQTGDSKQLTSPKYVTDIAMRILRVR